MRNQARGIWVLLGLALLPGCSQGGVGKRFESFSELTESRLYEDWVPMGRFGPSGPFTVVEERDYQPSSACSFRVGSQKHQYTAIPGHAFRVVFLQTEKGLESALVLRTREKTATASPR